MLKIKDNVDLRELEKFGFRNTQFYWQKDYKTRPKNKEQLSICIDACREICIYYESNFADIDIDNELDDLFDLIIAGLVEKVEE